MTAGTYGDAWQDVMLIEVIDNAGTKIAFGGFTEEISEINMTEKDVEGLPLVNGGFIKKFNPMTDESITMKVYPLTAGVNAETTATGVEQLFHPQGTVDATQPIVVKNTHTRNPFGLILLWAETLPATAGTLPEAGKTAFRLEAINATMTVNKWDYSDKILSAEVTFKWTPFNKSGVSNKQITSTNGDAQLPAAITSATTAFA